MIGLISQRADHSRSRFGPCQFSRNTQRTGDFYGESVTNPVKEMALCEGQAPTPTEGGQLTHDVRMGLWRIRGHKSIAATLTAIPCRALFERRTQKINSRVW